MLRKAIFILPKVVLLYGLGALIFDRTASAQVIPDNTLPINSTITSNDNTLIINGGTVVGDNLFHSFEQFTISTGNSSYFNNASNIQNIFGRVTGLSVSNIDGAIKANGTANLFLLNPNGIIFGPSASLNLGGSFLGSTANYVDFSDGSKFSATEPQLNPLLTINAPIGLGFNSNPGQISVQGIGHDLKFADPTSPLGFPIVGTGQSLTGLATSPEKTLALIGGQVKLDGGVLTASSGQIEIGSVAEGVVDLTLSPAGFSLNYNNSSNFRDIYLTGRSLLDASGVLNGKINIQGKNLYINDGSLVLISNFGSLYSGKININTTDSIVLTGVTDPAKFALLTNEIARGVITQNFSSFQGTDIDISTKNLVVQDFTGIGTYTFAEGAGGNINISVQDKLQLLGYPPIPFIFLPSSISTFTFGSGSAGNLLLSGNYLSIKDGGLLFSQTFNSGKGGNITTNFFEGVEISGSFPINFAFSSFLPSTLGTVSVSSGNAGNVFINTRQLNIKDGGRVNATTAVDGRAGNIEVNASDVIEVEGKVLSSNDSSLYNRSQIVSSATRNNSFLLQLLNLPDSPEGESGNVQLNTNRLIVQNEAQISVINEGTGNGGEIIINSRSVFLDNGSIVAETLVGKGGNIEINSSDLLLMRRNSEISTSAGNAQAGGDGGQISINTSLVVAPSLENSDITANAFEGRGGNIEIAAKGIFGIESRTKLTPLSDINASSTLGINGTVQIDTLNSQIISTTTLSENIVQPLEITSTCQANSNTGTNTFVTTGTGGIPPNPDNFLSGNSGWSDRSSVPQSENSLEEPLPVVATQIIEAQGWKQNPDGTVILTVEPTGISRNSSQATLGCKQTPSSRIPTTVKDRNLK